MNLEKVNAGKIKFLTIAVISRSEHLDSIATRAKLACITSIQLLISRLSSLLIFAMGLLNFSISGSYKTSTEVLMLDPFSL